MGAGWLPVVAFTLIWGLVGGVAPRFVPSGPHKQLLQLCLVMTGLCCWMFWLFCYMCQMNPLLGPALDKNALVAVKHYWGDWDE